MGFASYLKLKFHLEGSGVEDRGKMRGMEAYTSRAWQICMSEEKECIEFSPFECINDKLDLWVSQQIKCVI